MLYHSYMNSSVEIFINIFQEKLTVLMNLIRNSSLLQRCTSTDHEKDYIVPFRESQLGTSAAVGQQARVNSQAVFWLQLSISLILCCFHISDWKPILLHSSHTMSLSFNTYCKGSLEQSLKMYSFHLIEIHEAYFLNATDGPLHCIVCRQLMLRALWLHRTICFRVGRPKKERANFSKVASNLQLHYICI